MKSGKRDDGWLTGRSYICEKMNREHMIKAAYRSFTAAPWKTDEAYREIEPASPGLAGIVRCFWGSGRPYRRAEGSVCPTIVVPDTCADIIYRIDHTENTVTGNFCGISDTSFVNYENIKPDHLVSIFAIRFYGWGTAMFSEDSLKGTLNGCCAVGERFDWLDRRLSQQLFEKDTLEERSRVAEQLLLERRPWPDRSGSQETVDGAVARILMRKGSLGAAELAEECFVSSRQLERLFQEYMGIPPKKLCGLVRYQCLWNEILRNPDFNMLDAVYKLGYTDQSHLMREFKRYHTMDIKSAVRYARLNTPEIHVGNIQYSVGDS